MLSGMRLLALCWVSFRDYGGCLGVPHCIFLSVSVRLCLVIYIYRKGEAFGLVRLERCILVSLCFNLRDLCPYIWCDTVQLELFYI